jgi:diguanylate cyclase (GGDEF)-like protein
MLAAHPGQLLMSSLYSIFCVSDSQHEQLGEMLDSVALGGTYENFEWKIASESGIRHVLCSMLPKPGPNGEIVGAILAAVDVTAQKVYELQIEAQLAKINQYSSEIEARKLELEAANRRLEGLASTDGLTGLLNHRAFFDAFELATSQQQAKFPISVILLDVDDFKSYNDTYGHPEGDVVLRNVARALTSQTRNTDVVARYGGEEFVILLKNTSAERAGMVAERMRAAIEGTRWPHRRVTASFGVATIVDNSENGVDLVAIADQALYVSKRNGKNRVTLAASMEQSRAA